MDDGGESSTPQSKNDNIKSNTITVNKIIVMNKPISSGGSTDREIEKNNNNMVNNTVNNQKNVNKENNVAKNKTNKKNVGSKKVYENMIGPKDDVASITERINKLKKSLRNSVESSKYNYGNEK